MGHFDKKVSKSSEKQMEINSYLLKRENVELAKRCTGQRIYGKCVYEFARWKCKQSTPNRQPLIGKFNQRHLGNMSAMKEVEKADKNGSVFYIPLILYRRD